ncbi:alanyl-tRNA editing protein [Thermococcus piezophilus]|uniref:Alanyl-tRNA editing protein AlaX n=1 Tax=Thermococcus piezophilus TaxID=1712654 RepID=A0A172WFT7_9EURY|nr:DHHA1 domain-containing protein [Thermococcus piezophilus]ANF22312.1 alanyl-tRNA editing protein AlaX [Thermococcus piezophilus]
MTKRLFYTDPYLKESIAIVQAVEQGKSIVRLTLDRTIFYPEGGGQPSDKGIIRGEGFEIKVERVYGRDEIWHEGKIEGRLPQAGEEVKLKLDWEWRYENMKQHTGQHILSAVLKDLYDSNTTGFQIFENYNKIEIDFEGKLTWEHILRAEIRANEIVQKDLPVEIEFYEELTEHLRKQLRKELSDKVKPPIRIVRIPGVDVIPCGGTHVKSTREVGFIKVVNFYKKSKNIWRVEFACGNRVLNYLDELLKDYWGSLDEMPNKNRPLVERVKELKNEIEKLEEERKALRLEVWEWKAKVLLSKAEEVGGIRVISHVEELDMKDAQAFVVYLVDKNPNSIALVVGKNYVIFAKNRGVKGVSMRALLREVLEETGGGGGGSEVLAKGGGFKVEPEKVLEIAQKKLKHFL